MSIPFVQILGPYKRAALYLKLQALPHSTQVREPSVFLDFRGQDAQDRVTVNNNYPVCVLCI